MSRFSPTPALVLVRAASTALALALLDALLGFLRRGPEPTSSGEQLEALRFCAGLVLVVYLASWATFALARPRFDLNAAAFSGALLLALVVAIVDVDLIRWEDVRMDAGAARASVERGLLAGILAYAVLVRLPRSSKAKKATEVRDGESARPGRVHAMAAALGALALLVAPALASEGADAPAREVRTGHRVPRVLMIVVDTLRADALSFGSAASGSPPATPEIDRLAEAGHVFTNARTPGAWTLPSVASLMTGVSPLVHRAVTRFSALPETLPTLAERMAQDGYRTAAIGHNFVLSNTRKLDRGFDTYAFGKRRDTALRSIGFLRVIARLRAAHKSELNANEINVLAFDWLEAHQNEDFFLWLHYFDPHLNYDPPKDLRPGGAPPAGMGHRYGHAGLADIRAGYEVPTLEQRRWIKSLYDAEVRSVDRALGELFGKLAELGLYDDTLIVLTSDHGEEFWEHEGFEHGHTLYEEVVDVPLVVKLPGQSAGTVTSAPASLENLFPSILTLCGIDYDDAELSASSLFDAGGRVRELARSPQAGTGTCYFQNRVAVMFSGWKYIRWLETGAEELYDLNTDPDERVSLVGMRASELTEGRRRCDEVLDDATALRDKLGLSGAAEADLGAGELEALQDLGYAAGGV